MSIIRTNNASDLDRTFDQAWLESKGFFDKSSPIIEKSFEIFGGVVHTHYKIRHSSPWELFRCYFVYANPNPACFEFQSEMIYHHHFPSKSVFFKKEVIVLLDEIEKYKKEYFNMHPEYQKLLES